MIRVKKNNTAPTSLSKAKSYDGEDVKKTLLEDHFRKCYLCERKLVTDFEIEHHKSIKHNPALKQDWNNLFLACKYCNGKKLHNYDNLIHPLSNVEEAIVHCINFTEKQAEFTSVNKSTPSIDKTIQLLSAIFNGTSSRGRQLKEECFFEYCISKITHFQDLVVEYLFNRDNNIEIAIKEELAIDKELLGFKYWIIMKNSTLKHNFSSEIIWHKNNLE